MNGIHEVSGSIPLGSTNEINALEKFEFRIGRPVAHWSHSNACRAGLRDVRRGPRFEGNVAVGKDG